jgi:hypothetical protein
VSTAAATAAVATGIEPPVLRMRDVAWAEVAALFEPQGLALQRVPDGEPIPGSYWGESEAGLIGNTLYLRDDTPVHSALHEGCHWLCMDEARRATLHTDAGGEYAEEDAVCYLQLLLAQRIRGFGLARACQDMDAWGYTFRLGSAAQWFAEDAAEARAWLERAGLCSAT